MATTGRLDDWRQRQRNQAQWVKKTEGQHSLSNECCQSHPNQACPLLLYEAGPAYDLLKSLQCRAATGRTGDTFHELLCKQMTAKQQIGERTLDGRNP
jgi:hypothetical protein